MPTGKHTLHEILSQPAVWQHALATFAAHRADFLHLTAAADFDRVLVSGCGSTYYLSLFAASLLRQSGLDALACPASELLLHPQSLCLPDQKYLLLTLSRSGTTTETVRAQANFKRAIGGTVITVTCAGDSPLAQSADLAFAIDAAQEQSVAQTRSFSSMALLVQQMAGALAAQDLSGSIRLPAACQTLLTEPAALIESLAKDQAIEKFFFLGAGARYGLACEAMLKMKEMALAYSEAYHTLEFRHGPMSMIAADSLVIALLSPAALPHELQVLHEMRAMGARTLALTPPGSPISGTPDASQHHIALPAGLPDFQSPILCLPPLQLLAYHRAIANRQNPDQPHNLSAVISLDGI